MTQADDVSVLILAPHGRDGAVASAILGEVGIIATTCPSLEVLVAGLDASACAVVTEEALLSADRRALAEWVEQQPPWSDFPFILLTYRGGSPVEHLTELLGNVTVLERPFHPAVLVSAVRSAAAGAAAAAGGRGASQGTAADARAPGAAHPRTASPGQEHARDRPGAPRRHSPLDALR